MRILRPRSTAPVAGETTSQTESGAWVKAATFGRVAIRSRGQPARLGTRTSSPRWSSGSKRSHQPPGAPELPGGRSNGPSRSAKMREAARACGDAGRGLVTSSPSMISATRWSGTRSRSAYVARRGAPPTSSSIARGPSGGPRAQRAFSASRRHAWDRGREANTAAQRGPRPGQALCARTRAGRARQRPSQACTFGALPRSNPTIDVSETTEHTFRSATLKVSPRRYGLPASAPSRTASGFLNRSAALATFLSSRCASGRNMRFQDRRDERLLGFGHRPEAPLEGATLALDRLRPQPLIVLAGEVEVDHHRLPDDQIAVLECRSTSTLLFSRSRLLKDRTSRNSDAGRVMLDLVLLFFRLSRQGDGGNRTSRLALARPRR